VLAVKASEEGLSPKEIGELIGVSAASLAVWLKAYQQGGVEALSTKRESKSSHKLCRALEERIEEHRRAHPEHGVRRIRDELKRDEALQVSAETVRRVVNDAGLGQTPVQPKRKPPLYPVKLRHTGPPYDLAPRPRLIVDPSRFGPYSTPVPTPASTLRDKTRIPYLRMFGNAYYKDYRVLPGVESNILDLTELKHLYYIPSEYCFPKECCISS